MFSLLSNKITAFLCRKGVIPEEQKEVYQYGFEVLLLNVLDVLIILGLGIVIKRYVDTVVFLLVFGVTRQYTGGYHAKTVLKCLTVYVIIYLTVMFISSSNIVLCMGVLLQVLLCVLYIVAVVIYAPIQNDNKVISSTEKKKYKTISVVLGVTISMVAIALYGVLTTTALTISLTLFAVTLLMALVMIRKRGDYNEKD
jgi:accessory gene regulator B